MNTAGGRHRRARSSVATSARSGAPDSLIPHASPPATKPGAAVTLDAHGWIPSERQAGRLGQAEQQVGGLDHLARRAFHEVVLGRDRDDGVGARVEAHGDVHDVGAVRGLGARRLVDHDDARIVGVELAVVLEQPRGRQALGAGA